MPTKDTPGIEWHEVKDPKIPKLTHLVPCIERKPMQGHRFDFECQCGPNYDPKDKTLFHFVLN